MTKDLNLSSELLLKYNVQGPRYTSYPPAPSWRNDIGPEAYLKQLDASNSLPSPRPLSLYVHIPFCESLCAFCGCTTVITGKNRSFEKPYLDVLVKEIEFVTGVIKRNRPVIQLHLGGGTPTYLLPANLDHLLDVLRSRFDVAKDAEMGVEIDPCVTTSDHLTVLQRHGVNRLSMGVQDFDPRVQAIVRREQPFSLTKEIMDQARGLGFASVNIDLIYGLPGQSVEGFTKTIELILSLNPDRLAVYSFAYVPWIKKHQASIHEPMPQPQEKFKILLTAIRLLTEAGYEYIGMDHFAKPTDELARARKEGTLWRNFQGYTTKAGTDLIGMGMSSISHVRGAYFQNHRNLRDYQSVIQGGGLATMRGFIMNSDDQIRARVIQNLLCHAAVVKPEIEKEFELKFDRYFEDALETLREPAKDGLVEVSAEEIRPTPVGRLFLRNLAMAFDAYLPKEGEKRVFSRTL
ncbi:MAG: oxygen-independent coproporphyrinogen III oxidase [Elusimicrobia bacterium]|nr:oxygen-independent coproporphyrinogen III oxidase [Candidatus Obscuribacterium magneticum]